MGIIKQDLKKSLYIQEIYGKKYHQYKTRKNKSKSNAININKGYFEKKVSIKEIIKLLMFNLALIILFIFISFCGYFIYKFVSY